MKTMKDEIIQEVWRAKDTVAAKHHYNVRALVKHLRERENASQVHVVDLHSQHLKRNRATA